MSGSNTLPPEVLAQIKAGFLEECEEILGALQTGLLALRQGNRDPEIVNTVFRAAHSIKGGAASFGLDALVRFARQMEAVLAEIRSKRMPLSGEVLNLLLKASDLLADHVNAARAGGQVEASAARDVERALTALLARDGKYHGAFNSSQERKR